MSVQTRKTGTSCELVHALATKKTTQVNAHKRQRVNSALSARIRAVQQNTSLQTKKKTPIMRMRECRDALAFLNTTGWNRSFH